MSKKKSSFWQDFKAFISRGNIIDMAVGVVIGKAFGNIVTGLVNYIINPFVGLFMKEGSLDDIKTVIRPEVVTDGVVTTKEVALLWGTWFQTILDFLIVALCIFTVVRLLMKAKNHLDAEKIAAAEAKAAEEKAKAAEAAKVLAEKEAKLEAATLHQEELLAEIRDLMKNK